ncbi:hypothetical protein ACJX0J_019467 [Zea mays]
MERLHSSFFIIDLSIFYLAETQFRLFGTRNKHIHGKEYKTSPENRRVNNMGVLKYQGGKKAQYFLMLISNLYNHLLSSAIIFDIIFVPKKINIMVYPQSLLKCIENLTPRYPFGRETFHTEGLE